MRRGAAFPLAAMLCGLGVAVIAPACSSPEETAFGGPASLANRLPPDPTYPTKGDPATTGGALDLAQVCGGTAPPPADANCAVKWATLFDKIKAGGPWNCGNASCHGVSAAGKAAYEPGVTTDPTTTYNNFVAFKIGGTKRYINPCSKNPDESGFPCNLAPALSGCGAHMPQGQDLPATETDPLRTWLACGAPP